MTGKGPLGRLLNRLDRHAADYTVRLAEAELDEAQRTGKPPRRALARQVARAADVASGTRRADLLLQHAQILSVLFNRDQRRADLDEAIESASAAAEADPTDPASRDCLAHLLGYRFQLTGAQRDLDLAERAYQEALGLLDRDDVENHSQVEAALAGIWLLRFRSGGDLAALRQAHQQAMVAIAGPARPPDQQLMYARILADVYMAGRDLAALRTASDLLAALCSGLGRDHDDFAAAHATYAEVLALRNAEHARPGLSEQAVEAARTAVAASAPSAGHAVNLALAVLADGRPELLDEAAGALRAMLAVVDPESIDWAPAVGNLIEVLRRRHDHRPEGTDLDEAIAWGRRGLALLAAGHPRRAQLGANLAAALQSRNRRYGDSAALREAHELIEDASDQITGDHHQRAAVNVAVAYTQAEAFLAAGDPASLAQARTLLDGLLATVPKDASIRGQVLVNAATLALVADAARPAEAVDTALRYATEAVELTPTDHPARPTRVQLLGNALRLRYLRTENPADLARSVALLRQAHRLPAEDPRRVVIGVDLGRAIALQSLASSNPGLLRPAVALSRECAEAVTAPAGLRLEAATEWGIWSALGDDWAGAVAGFRRALAVMPATIPLSLDRPTQKNALVKMGAVGSDAAAVLLEYGARTGTDTAADAVTALEQARTLLLTRDLAYHQGADQLRQRHPKLFAELAAAREALDAEVPDLAAAGRWERLLAEIRGKRGFGRFMMPPEEHEQRAATAGRTVVVVNVSRFRCDALVLDRGRTTVVPLPDLDADVAREHALAIRNPPDLAIRDPHDAHLGVVLPWLWRTVAEPVLAALGDDPPDRLWWMPTGPLTALPLHAATSEDGQSSLLDRFVSSYVPSLRLLLAAQDRPAARTAPVTAVVAADVPGMPPLPAAEEETSAVAERFPEAVVRTGPDAAEALRLVRTSGWLHLACHAKPQPGVVPEWALLLGDSATLGVSDVARAGATDGRLAFLSACETAVGETSLADESLTLASAFLTAGYRQVIATLWTVSDRVMLRVVRDFYQSLPADPAEGAARVLHEAVGRARRWYPDHPSAWAQFVHLGP